MANALSVLTKSGIKSAAYNKGKDYYEKILLYWSFMLGTVKMCMIKARSSFDNPSIVTRLDETVLKIL